MANLIIKPNSATGDKLIIQDRAGGAVLTTADSGAALNNISLNPVSSAPGGAVEGQMYYNSTTKQVLVYTGTSWKELSQQKVKASGGEIKIVKIDNVTYVVHTFLTSGSFIPTESLTIDWLVIAGGGGGAQGFRAGGGGAGGYRCSVEGEKSGGDSSTDEAALSVTAITYTINVGAGGAAGYNSGTTGQITTGGTGGVSSIVGSNITDVTTAGGGGGGGSWVANAPGAAGGSGGGGGGWSSSTSNSGGAGTANQGNAGGKGAVSNTQCGGGGGGAGGEGYQGQRDNNEDAQSLGDGGIGMISTIDGTPTYRAGGGGGGNYDTGNETHGGLGGGAAGSRGSGSTKGFNGSPNTGAKWRAMLNEIESY